MESTLPDLSLWGPLQRASQVPTMGVAVRAPVSPFMVVEAVTRSRPALCPSEGQQTSGQPEGLRAGAAALTPANILQKVLPHPVQHPCATASLRPGRKPTMETDGPLRREGHKAWSACGTPALEPGAAGSRQGELGRGPRAVLWMGARSSPQRQSSQLTVSSIYSMVTNCLRRSHLGNIRSTDTVRCGHGRE